eukprot:CAMPEP_0184693802 /NCGR_PEP_ID=MMETSP0313-20130426/1958_1 /TAXON_ID=2792 /ORGANISM="Porphyridium aerugineum, Strain SAG 1380-2" /LENGTH=865 /DNA_ID=CAMNT_0027151973 /DNA_START=407 /DNA_END=3004 /DNA_ORIENTATION=+
MIQNGKERKRPPTLALTVCSETEARADAGEANTGIAKEKSNAGAAKTRAAPQNDAEDAKWEMTSRGDTKPINGMKRYWMLSRRGIKRKACEDACSAVSNEEEGNVFAFFGVFDGHGGPHCSQYAAQNLIPNVVSHEKFRDDDPREAFRHGFLKTDSSFIAHQAARRAVAEIATLRQHAKLQTKNQKEAFRGNVLSEIKTKTVVEEDKGQQAANKGLFSGQVLSELKSKVPAEEESTQADKGVNKDVFRHQVLAEFQSKLNKDDPVRSENKDVFRDQVLAEFQAKLNKDDPARSENKQVFHGQVLAELQSKVKKQDEEDISPVATRNKDAFHGQVLAELKSKIKEEEPARKTTKELFKGSALGELKSKITGVTGGDKKEKENEKKEKEKEREKEKEKEKEREKEKEKQQGSPSARPSGRFHISPRESNLGKEKDGLAALNKSGRNRTSSGAVESPAGGPGTAAGSSLFSPRRSHADMLKSPGRGFADSPRQSGDLLSKGSDRVRSKSTKDKERDDLVSSSGNLASGAPAKKKGAMAMLEALTKGKKKASDATKPEETHAMSSPLHSPPISSPLSPSSATVATHHQPPAVNTSPSHTSNSNTGRVSPRKKMLQTEALANESDVAERMQNRLNITSPRARPAPILMPMHSEDDPSKNSSVQNADRRDQPEKGSSASLSSMDSGGNSESQSEGGSPNGDRNDFGSGSTAVTALIRKGRLYVAHAGDSRAVISENGAAKQLTEDHRATREDEAARIEAAGGFVLMGRVEGTLAVSRGLGDEKYKKYVLPEPEVSLRELDPSDRFLIMATDGLWDWVKNQDAINIIENECEAKQDQFDLEIATRLLVEEALNRGSTDDLTVIVIDLRYFGS